MARWGISWWLWRCLVRESSKHHSWFIAWHCLLLLYQFYYIIGWDFSAVQLWMDTQGNVCVCFLVFMFLEIVLFFVVTSSDFTEEEFVWHEELVRLAKAYTVPITHHIILEQSKCVCVRVCTRACCEHCFLIVCVSFRTQGSAVSYRWCEQVRFDISCPSMRFYPVLAVR